MVAADWSRFRRFIEPDAVPVAIEDDEPTVRIPRESGEDLMRRPATRPVAELEAELAQHAGEGQ